MMGTYVIHIVPGEQLVFFLFKQKTAYEMRISDWSSDVCSSDLLIARADDAACLNAVIEFGLIGIRLDPVGQAQLATEIRQLRTAQSCRAQMQMQRQRIASVQCRRIGAQ